MVAAMRAKARARSERAEVGTTVDNHGRDLEAVGFQVSRSGARFNHRGGGAERKLEIAGSRGVHRNRIRSDCSCRCCKPARGRRFVPLVVATPSCGVRLTSTLVCAARVHRLGRYFSLVLNPPSLALRRSCTVLACTGRGSTCRNRAWAPPDGACCPRCVAEGNTVAAQTRPPTRVVDLPCSCSGWRAHRAQPGPAYRGIEVACPCLRCGGASRFWPATGSRRSSYLVAG